MGAFYAGLEVGRGGVGAFYAGLAVGRGGVGDWGWVHTLGSGIIKF